MDKAISPADGTSDRREPPHFQMSHAPPEGGMRLAAKALALISACARKDDYHCGGEERVPEDSDSTSRSLFAFF